MFHIIKCLHITIYLPLGLYWGSLGLTWGSINKNSLDDTDLDYPKVICTVYFEHGCTTLQYKLGTAQDIPRILSFLLQGTTVSMANYNAC